MMMIEENTKCHNSSQTQPKYNHNKILLKIFDVQKVSIEKELCASFNSFELLYFFFLNYSLQIISTYQYFLPFNVYANEYCIQAKILAV